MLKYLPHSEIDLTCWDNCIAASAENLIYATSGYLDISTDKRWDAIVEILDGNYVSVFPVPYKKRLGIKFTYQPLQLQQLGLYTTSASQQKTIAPYLELLRNYFPKIFLQLNTQNTFALGELPQDFTVAPRITYLLDLHDRYENLKEKFSTNLKRNLKKAQKQNYQLSETGNIADLLKLYRQTRGRDLKELKNRHYHLFEKQYHFLLQNSLAQVWEIRQEGILIAGAFFLMQPGKPIFLFSAASETGKKNGAMAFLINTFIQKHAGSDAVLDFEGGSIPNLARFYGSFGAKPVPYLSVSRNNLPWYLKWLIK